MEPEGRGVPLGGTGKTGEEEAEVRSDNALGLKVVRTPEERFAPLARNGLYPFRSHYVEDLPSFHGLRIHYLDEGNPSPSAPHTFLCLHGEPTWSFLYRKMIPVFVAAGCRVVAPDFMGFGKSDKPIRDSDYSFSLHRNVLLEFIQRLDLRNITLVCQDWGGVLGLTLPMEMPWRFQRLLVMNTGLGTGRGLGKGFLAWRDYCNKNPDLPVGKLIKRGTQHLSEEEVYGYDAPFPSATYKAGVRVFPNLVPSSPDAEGADISRKAQQFWQHQWTGHSFMAIGAADPVLGLPVMMALHKCIRNCPPPLILKEAGHFVQEWGEEVATKALQHWDGATNGLQNKL
ncbi:Haloalkane dehalogenase [Balamuthia mandrillaris]